MCFASLAVKGNNHLIGNGYTYKTDMDTKMNNRDHAIALLAKGYSEEFADYLRENDRVADLVQELASEFVEKNIPIVDEDASTDVAMELVMSVTMKTV